MSSTKSDDDGVVQLNALTITGVEFDVIDELRGHSNKSEKGSSTKDEDNKLGVMAGLSGDNVAIEPPFDYDTLALFAVNSSTLDPCISAMEVNVEATGHDIVSTKDIEGEDLERDPVYQQLVELFREPYPNTTMIGLRKRLRRDLEHLGNAFIEVILSNDGVPLFLKYLNAKYTRLIKYSDDDTTTATISVKRNGNSREMKVQRQERRFVYRKGSVTRYLCEMGASRDLDRDTGEWGKIGNRLPAAKRSTRVVHLKAKETPESVYALPRWISQIRSVAGETEAEGLNLTYFKNGGIPPLLIFLQNGKLTEGSKLQLDAALQGKAASKQQGVVVETVSTSGSLDKAGTVNVKVERFGSDRQSDSMFGKYSEDCYVKIKSSYRIPQLFIGRTDDYNYATAYAAIVVGEAQVFKPERDEFDDIINNTIVRVISSDYEFQSKPLVAVDVEIQKGILELVSNIGAISNEELIKQANKLSNLNLIWNGKEAGEANAALLTAIKTAMGNTGSTATSTDEADLVDTGAEADTAQKSERLGFDSRAVEGLAADWARVLTTNKADIDADEVAGLRTQLSELSPLAYNLFEVTLAQAMVPTGGTLSQTIIDLNTAAANLLMAEV